MPAWLPSGERRRANNCGLLAAGIQVVNPPQPVPEVLEPKLRHRAVRSTAGDWSPPPPPSDMLLLPVARLPSSSQELCPLSLCPLAGPSSP